MVLKKQDFWKYMNWEPGTIVGDSSRAELFPDPFKKKLLACFWPHRIKGLVHHRCDERDDESTVQKMLAQPFLALARTWHPLLSSAR